MFGSNDKTQTDNTQQANDTLPLIVPAGPVGNDSMVSVPPDHLITPTAPTLNDTPALPADEPVLPPVQPPPSIITDSSKAKDSSVPEPTAPPLQPPSSNDGELINIKQQALNNLAPMVNQLDQTPEEKFKTTMMLIQASDNANLIKDAYDAANAITDEKARAHALLDVVNEINYFTQQHENNQSA